MLKNPPPTFEQLLEMFEKKSSLSERPLSNYEQLSLLKQIDYLHPMITGDPHLKPAKSVIKRINDLKKELLKLEADPEMLDHIMRLEKYTDMQDDKMIDKIRLLIQKSDEMPNRPNEMPNSKRRRVGGGRNKRRRTLKRTRKYKW